MSSFFNALSRIEVKVMVKPSTFDYSLSQLKFRLQSTLNLKTWTVKFSISTDHRLKARPTFDFRTNWSWNLFQSRFLSGNLFFQFFDNLWKCGTNTFLLNRSKTSYQLFASVEFIWKFFKCCFICNKELYFKSFHLIEGNILINILSISIENSNSFESKFNGI
jgi:hypothetical protein